MYHVLIDVDASYKMTRLIGHARLDESDTYMRMLHAPSLRLLQETVKMDYFLTVIHLKSFLG
jgi:hypothetical protein